MRNIIIILLSLCLSGCIPLLIGGGVGAGLALSKHSVSQVTSINRQHLLKLSIGMNKEEAIRIMGDKPMGANYTEISSHRKITRGITITNPYRSETLQGKDKTFEVLYYVTDDKASNGVITDDDLTPLVFDNGKLIGWGQSFLQDNIQKYEIRLR